MRNGGIIDCLRKGGTIPTCKCGEKIKAQDGTKLSRTDSLNMLRTTGSTNKESRQEYRAAKRDARSSGLRGNEMRQTARFASMQRGLDRMLPAFDDIVIEDEPIVINDKSFTNLDTSVPTVQKIDRFGGNFNSAFAAAKRNGLDKFY